MRDLAEQRRVRTIVAVAGAFLLLTGAALVLVGAGARGQADAEVARQPAAAAASAEEDPATTPAPRQVAEANTRPTVENQPEWRIKQQEAQARIAEEQSERDTMLPAGSGATGAAATQDARSGNGASGVASVQPAPAPSGGTSAPTTAGPVAPPASSSGTRTVGTSGQTPLTGVWGGTAQELADYLLANNPNPRFTVDTTELAGYYVTFAREVGLRADVLWAQMIHETGFGKYGGDVGPQQNNYAGIGATGGGAQGHAWATAADGVKGHIAHMVAYAFTEDKAAWTSRAYDPRYDLVSPRGQAKVLSDLDGRWAVPGNGYGERIETHVRAINR